MSHAFSRIFELVAILGCLSSSAYYLLGIWSASVFVRTRNSAASSLERFHPPVTILKPLKGIDPDIYEAFRSHCLQDYPEYEIIFGVSDANDAAIASVEQLKREFPQIPISLVVCPTILGANIKVSNLDQMVRSARYEHLIVNDSDIRVEHDYLQKTLAPFADERVGMVTSLYRGVPESTVGSQLEAFGISTDFSAGVLVAQQIEGGLHFGLGSTLAFRRSDLDRIGGFEAIVDFLADDYELGRRIADLGKKVVLSSTVVETHLPSYDFGGFLSHQMRWARGVRDARLGGYIGLVSTFGLLWSLLGVIAAHGVPWSWGVLAVVMALRFAVAFSIGKAVLQDSNLVSQLWLLPLRDLIAVGVWVVSFFGHTVVWRGEQFVLKNGRLLRT